MAIEVDGKIYRNLPEQVEENANQIEDLKTLFSTLGTVMVYKGSVATYADLPTENQKVGDVYNVIDTGNNYAWDGEGWDEIGSTVDLSAYLTKVEAQATYAPLEDINYVVLKDHVQFGALTGGEAYQMRNGGFVPTFASFNGNQRQGIFMQLTYISGTTYRATGWFLDSSRNMYIYEGQIGNVAEGSSTNLSYSNFTEKKFIDLPTKDSFGFKIIPAPSSTTLTADELNDIIGGAIINGTFLGVNNLVFFPTTQNAGVYHGMLIYKSGNRMVLTQYYISSSNVISINTSQYQRLTELTQIEKVNGKSVPNYPADTGTFNLQMVDGTMAWNSASSGGTKLYKHQITGITSAPGDLFIISTTQAITGTPTIAQIITLLKGAIRSYYGWNAEMWQYDIITNATSSATNINTFYVKTSGTPPQPVIDNFALTDTAISNITYSCTELTNS